MKNNLESPPLTPYQRIIKENPDLKPELAALVELRYSNDIRSFLTEFLNTLPKNKVLEVIHGIQFKLREVIAGVYKNSWLPILEEFEKQI